MAEVTMKNLQEDNSLNPAILFTFLFIMGWFSWLLICSYFVEVWKQSTRVLKGPLRMI
jgi:hypothetical protein